MGVVIYVSAALTEPVKMIGSETTAGECASAGERTRSGEEHGGVPERAHGRRVWVARGGVKGRLRRVKSRWRMLRSLSGVHISDATSSLLSLTTSAFCPLEILPLLPRGLARRLLGRSSWSRSRGVASDFFFLLLLLGLWAGDYQKTTRP